MKKPCPNCNKRRLKRHLDKEIFPKCHVVTYRCQSCSFHWLTWKQEKKVDKRMLPFRKRENL